MRLVRRNAVQTTLFVSGFLADAIVHIYVIYRSSHVYILGYRRRNTRSREELADDAPDRKRAITQEARGFRRFQRIIEWREFAGTVRSGYALTNKETRKISYRILWLSKILRFREARPVSQFRINLRLWYEFAIPISKRIVIKFVQVTDWLKVTAKYSDYSRFRIIPQLLFRSPYISGESF